MPPETKPDRRLRLGVLVSGSGRTLQNLLDRSAAATLSATVNVVIASRGDAYGLERARAAGVRAVIVERRGTAPDVFHQRIAETLSEAGVDLVCLAGFLSLWEIPPAFAGRVINVHPALLPAFGGRGFYGARVHEAVLAAGCKVSGCTVHFADNEYDHGPIISQRVVPVREDDTADTLAARVFSEERVAFPEAIEWFAAGRLRIEGTRVRILNAPEH